MPDLGCGAYLVGYLWDIGPTSGEWQITQSEIAAWQTNMGVDLQPWEVTLLRRLSLDHLLQAQKSTAPDCRPPWGDLYRAPNVDSKIDALLD